MRDLNSIEEKILDKALYLFGKSGSTNVSIRAISKEAGVNVSAINYYFRSKEQMLANVQSFYIENTISSYAPLYNDELNDEEKIILCSNEIMEYAIKYPGVLVMQKEATNAIEKTDMDIKIIETQKSMNQKLNELLERVLKNSKTDFEFNRIVFFSSILYPTNDHNITVNNNDSNSLLLDKNKRLNYIKHLIYKLKS